VPGTGPGNWRIFALASLLCALAFLGAAQLSQAATWTINPRIENATGSGETAPGTVPLGAGPVRDEVLAE
jgi:hypothetical protein